MQRLYNFAEGIAPTVNRVTNQVGDLLVGLGINAIMQAPPSKVEFTQTIGGVCFPLNSGDPKILLCKAADFAPVLALFGDGGISAMGIGAGLIGIVILGGVANGIYECTSGPEGGVFQKHNRLNRLKTFADNTASILANLILNFGATFMSVGLANYIFKTGPLTQSDQPLEIICPNYFNSNSSFTCDLNKATDGMFTQANTTPIIAVGATIRTVVTVSQLVYAGWQSYKGEKPPDEVIPLDLSNNNPNDYQTV